MNISNLRRLITTFILFVGINAFATEKWVDVTSSYITNPGFTSSNKSEWTITGSANSLGSISYNCIEMWNGIMNLGKTVEGMPNGHYRLSLQGFYRTRDHATAYASYIGGDTQTKGFLYANDNEVALANEYSYSFSSSVGRCYTPDNKIYFANSMETASMAFSAGAYQNSLEFDITDGQLSFGVYNNESISDNWLIFTNFKIEYYTDVNEGNAESLVINEIMPANVDMYMSDATNFDSWMEIYNPTAKSVTIGGFYMSDDLNNLKKWKVPANYPAIPANSFKTVWFGHNDVNTYQAQFKLDCDGGTIYISDANGNLITSQDYPSAISRTSYARKTDGGTEWGMTGTPTPGATNATASFSTIRLDAPTVSPDGQLFEGTLNVSVNIPSGATLRFTTDGTTPTLTNGETSTTGLFYPSVTTNYRFRLFKDGYLPSTVTTRSYIFREHDFTLPVISVTTDDDYLYDEQIGIYVKGTNGRTGNGQSTPANWNMEWERPVNFEYILPDNTMAINQDVDMAISGGWTRSNAVKAFKLKASKVYDGLNSYNYQFFTAKPYIKSKTIQVRAGGNDTGCRIKDAAIQTIIQKSGIDIDLQSYQPTVHYINGVYKGVINVREPNNKDYAYSNFGYDDDEIEMFEQSPDSGRYMMLGTPETLERIETLSETANLEDSYAELKQLIDMDEYINYMAMQLYLGSTDWPDNNLKAYRKIDGGRYRITTFDLDFIFSTDDTFNWFASNQQHTYDYIYDEGGSRSGEIKFVTVFLNMLKNDEFRKKFIDTYSIMGGSVFEPTRAKTYTTELGDRVRTIMSYSGSSPDGSLNTINSGLSSRMETMMARIKAYDKMQLTNTTAQSAKLNTTNSGGNIYINDVKIPYNDFNGKLFAPVTLKAKPLGGYKFTGWEKVQTNQSVIFDNGSSWTYYDDGTLDGTGWNGTSYNDDSWAVGEAPLGYNKNQKTTLDYGTDTRNKRPTYYFRKKFTLSNAPSSASTFNLNYTVDDGFVVYINGTEGGRYNLASGDITYNTFASTADSNPDKGTMELSSSLFKQGENIIAVEVHNNNLTSSDIDWDGQLTVTSTTGEKEYYSTEPEVTMPTDDSFEMTACFEPITDEEKAAEGITPVRINEISAANSIFTNDYFKRNDWVELYNTTSADVDVEGMYITDDTTTPHKYKITKGSSNATTIIPAHGHMIIWCDKLTPVSMLHASFKLAAEGGTVTLTAKDDTWSDALVYAAHNGDETVGRYPDGASKVYVMNIPTIDKENIYTSYVSEVKQTVPDNINNTLISDNNGLKIRYAAGHIIVRSETSVNASIRIYTIAGQDMSTTNISISGGKNETDVSSLANGCYIASVTDTEGNTATCKFVISK